MSFGGRTRQDSECSTVSSDSSLLDGSGQSLQYARQRDAESALLKRETGVRYFKGRRRTRCIAIVSLFISVVCLLFSGSVCYLVFRFRQDVKGGHNLPGASAQYGEAAEVCMPCEELRGSPMVDVLTDELDLLEVTVGDDGRSSCCASTPAQYAALFKLILRRQEEVKKLADMMASYDLPESKEGLSGTDGGRGRLPIVNITSGSAVSAHLISKPFNPKPTSADDLTIQQWKSDEESPISHVRPGLRFHENKIYVQAEGLYFVYCQILYTKTAADTAFPHSTVASNYVKRLSNTFPSSTGILLKSRHTSMDNDRHSNWVGGLFYLHPHDQVWVEVAIPELVAHDDTASFFGLFRIGN